MTPFIRVVSGFSVKQCLSLAAPALMNVSQTSVSPVCYHPCWTLTNRLTSFMLQLLFFGEVIGKHLFTARLHPLIQNVASASPIQAQFVEVTYFNPYGCWFLVFLCFCPVILSTQPGLWGYYCYPSTLWLVRLYWAQTPLVKHTEKKKVEKKRVCCI